MQASNTAFQAFEPSMARLDAMIHKLELNLGQKHSTSEFNILRSKFGGAPAPQQPQVEAKEEKKEEPKQENQQQKAPKEKKEKKEKQPKKGAAPAEPVLNLPDELLWYNTCDLRVGKIVECEICPNSDKLYIEKIDLGEGSLREIGSGLRQFVPIEEMTREGTLCVVFANLKPRKLAHIMSQGMVMCASNAEHTQIEVMRPPTGAKIGERVILEGNPIGDTFSQDRQDELKNKKKAECIPHFLGQLKTNDNCEATYNGIRLLTSAGVITSDTLKNVNIS